MIYKIAFVLRQKLTSLDEESVKLTDMLRNTKELASRSKADSEAAREKAMTIVSDARLLSVPDLDTDSLDAEAARIKDEAQEIIKTAEELLKDNEPLLNEVNDKIQVGVYGYR
jgi:hypothetical protein